MGVPDPGIDPAVQNLVTVPQFGAKAQLGRVAVVSAQNHLPGHPGALR